MATGRNRRQILLRLASEGRESVRNDLRGVRNDVRSLAREEVRLRIDVERKAAEAQIQRIEQRLERLSKQEASPKVDIATARALGQLEKLERHLDLLDKREVEIDVDLRRGVGERAVGFVGALNRRVDALGGSFSNLLRAVPLLGTTLGFALRGVLGIAANLGQVIGGVVTSAITNLTGSFGRMGGVIGSVVGGLVQVGFSLGAMAAMAGGAIIALNAILGAVVALGAALVALVASLTAAIGGLGALAVAFGAVLGPAVLVVIGLFTRFAAIMEARKAQEQALEQAVKDQRVAEERRTEAVRSAEQAEQRLARTVIDGRRAMAQAAEAYRDSLREVQNAEQGIRNADLSLDQAKASLREFLREAGASEDAMGSLMKQFTDVHVAPGALQGLFGAATGGKSVQDPLELRARIEAVRNARLAYKDAIERERDAEREAGEARGRHNEFLREGLNAYEPYVDATNALVEANRELAQTNRAVSSSQEDYQRKLKELSATERGSLDRLNRFIDGFKRLAQAFTDPIFRAINDVFDRLSGSTGFLERGLRLVGEAFGDVIRAFGEFLSRPSTQAAFSRMAEGAADLARTLGGSAFISFLTIMQNIALAALPALRRGAERVAEIMRGWAQASGTAEFAGRIRGFIGQFRNWLGLIKDVGLLIVEIFRAAAGAGGRLVTHMRNWVREQTELIRQNPHKVREFFERMVDSARAIVRGLRGAVHWLQKRLPGAAADAKAAFEDIKPVAELLRDVFKGMWEYLRDAARAWKFLKEGDLPSGKDFLESSGKRALKIMDLIFHEGGTVPGGANVPIVAQGGEEIIRRGIAAQLRPQLKMLNAGVPPEIAFAGGGGRSTTISQTFEIHKAPAGLDERALASWLDWRARRKSY